MALLSEIPDPSGYHYAASVLRRRADDLIHYSLRVDANVQRAVFEGPAANRMRETVLQQKAELLRLTEELRALANSLSRAAGVYEDQIASRHGD